MEDLARDLRFAARILARSPGFTLAVVLCMALGIGASSAVFNVVDAVLLRALPYLDPERIVIVWGPGEGNSGFRASSAQEVEDYRALEAFEHVASALTSFLNLTTEQEPERLVVTWIDPDFFPLLGVGADLGRIFRPEDAEPANRHVVVLSHGLWQRRFGAAPETLGKPVLLDGEPYTVVGVMPERFHFLFGPSESDLWLPRSKDPNRQPPRNVRFLGVVAKLEPRMTLERAQAALDTLAGRFEREHPEVYQGKVQLSLAPLSDIVVNKVVRIALLLLSGAVGLILLIACFNVANLMLAQSTVRQKEVALRVAVGADRLTLARQFLAEALLLSVLSGGLGLLLAWWALKGLIALNPEKLPRLTEIEMNTRGLVFTLIVVLATALVFGLVPVLHGSVARLYHVLKEGGKASAGLGRHRLRNILVVSEVALAVVVLVGVGLILRSFLDLKRVDPGFRPGELLTFQIFLSPSKYAKDAQRAACADQLIERLQSLPGVERVALVNSLPLNEVMTTTEATTEGRPLAPSETPFKVDWRPASPDYFRAMGIPLLHGRIFTAADEAGSPGVVIIDEMLARHAWPGKAPLGRRLQLAQMAGGKSAWLTVVGVVGHVRAWGLDADSGEQIYTPFAQSPRPLLSFVLRTASDPLALVPNVRRAVWSIDRDLPIELIRTMDEIVDRSVAGRRSYALLLAVFAAVTLVLVAMGVYGVMAYSVDRRTQEIGIRLVLGAKRGQVLRLVVRQGLALAGLGVASGLVLAFWSSRYVRSLLFGVGPTDALTYTGAALLLMGLAFLAIYIPARRAASIDSMAALRWD